MLETIYLIRQDEAVFVSNSLPFVLSSSGSALRNNYFEYQRDLCSSLFGLKKQIVSSPLRDNRYVEYYRCCDFEIDSELNIQKENKQSGFTFQNWEEYIGGVRQILSGLTENATSPDRITQYGMLSTISRGYDAVASSALAYEIGCRRVLTFTSPAKYADDNGSDIAKQLGYAEIIGADGEHYKQESVEAECQANGDIGSGVAFAAHYRLFQNCMVFMGVRGDSLWERGHANVNDDQDFTNGNGLAQTDHTFNELCFTKNAICVPIPMIGADRWSDLARLSNSEEMKPWSVRERYDRPIARRIAEEKGVPRDSFGQVKKGAGISYHFDNIKRICSKMSPQSSRDLQAFVKSFHQPWLKHTLHAIRFYAHEFPVYFNYLSHKLHLPLRLSFKESYISSPNATLLIHWGVDRTLPRYNITLDD